MISKDFKYKFRESLISGREPEDRANNSYI
jgi:hypothetical protein